MCANICHHNYENGLTSSVLQIKVICSECSLSFKLFPVLGYRILKHLIKPFMHNIEKWLNLL